MGVSQNYGYHFGARILRNILFWGLYWGPHILGKYHILLGFYWIMEKKMETTRVYGVQGLGGFKGFRVDLWWTHHRKV